LHPCGSGFGSGSGSTTLAVNIQYSMSKRGLVVQAKWVRDWLTCRKLWNFSFLTLVVMCCAVSSGLQKIQQINWRGLYAKICTISSRIICVVTSRIISFVPKLRISDWYFCIFLTMYHCCDFYPDPPDLTDVNWKITCYWTLCKLHF
jgi:hypothetical protein